MIGGLSSIDFSGIGDLGLTASVNVKLPPEVKAAVRELPNATESFKTIGAAVDAMNVTIQSVAAIGTFGLIIAVLLLREKRD